MKRSCYNCKASTFDKGVYGCSLWYPVKTVSDGRFSKGQPEQECPKPLTIIKLITHPQYKTLKMLHKEK